MDNKFELVISIINRGFSELVMDSARANGATGGTIINAKGTVVENVKTVLGVSIHPEKEIVLILTPKEKRSEIMTGICKAAGLNTLGNGIVFALPAEDVLGVSLQKIIESTETAEDVVKEEIKETKQDVEIPENKIQ